MAWEHRRVGGALSMRGRIVVAAGTVLVVAMAAVAALGSGGGPVREAPERPVAACPEPRAGVVGFGDRAGDEVALTFDDGPGAITPGILDALARRDAQATFFVLGREIPRREGILRRAAAEGHQIGNHSTHHTVLPSAEELEATSGLITAATGRLPCVFRPPEGRYDDRLLRTARRLGMTTVTWDVDAADWSTQEPALIRDRVLAAAQPGSIILMHDGGGDRAGTARAIAAVIRELQRRGLELVTVSDLLRGD
jgi:peptidoglycan-N-acetylglucosamine deacetylase